MVVDLTTFDRMGRIVAVVDDAGSGEQWRYDGMGRHVEREDAGGNRVLTSYDPSGNPVEVVSLEVHPDIPGDVGWGPSSPTSIPSPIRVTRSLASLQT